MVVLALGVVGLAVVEALGGPRLGLVALAVGVTAVSTLLGGGAGTEEVVHDTHETAPFMQATESQPVAEFTASLI